MTYRTYSKTFLVLGLFFSHFLMVLIGLKVLLGLMSIFPIINAMTETHDIRSGANCEIILLIGVFTLPLGAKRVKIAKRVNVQISHY